jgi:selenocysteine lyase/cysteine desulfurase
VAAAGVTEREIASTSFGNGISGGSGGIIQLKVNPNNLKNKEVFQQQQEFLKNYPHDFISTWKLTPLFDEKLLWHGHFLTFEAPDIAQAEYAQKKLIEQHILIDRRGPRLRIGFGLYQDQQDVLDLCQCLNKLAESPQ